jgi:adhesin transport system outer membrane protein
MKHSIFKTFALGTSFVALMMLTPVANAQDAGAMTAGAMPGASGAMPYADPPPANAPMAAGDASSQNPSPAASPAEQMQQHANSEGSGQPSATAVSTPGANAVTQAVGPQTETAPVTGNTMNTGHTMDTASDVRPTDQASAAHNLDSKVMNLRDTVAVGMLTNPEYRLVANNRRATDEELNQAVDLYFPSIDYRGDGGYEAAHNPTTVVLDNNKTTKLWRYDTGLTLTQLMFDGWETAYENQRQRFRVLSASNRVREASELVGLSVVESYLEVMRQRELLKAARDNVSSHMDILNQINDSSAAGRTTQADVEQARARVASARGEEASVREALRTAEAGFIQQVGDPPRDLVMPVVPVDQLAPDVEEEVKQTQYSSPTISIKQADMEVAHSEMDKAKAPMYPKIDFQLNGRTGKNLDGDLGQDSSASAEVVANWNLYRGGGDIARVREAIDRWGQSKEDRIKTQRDVDNDVRQTWARMVSAGERARQFASQADANVEVVKAYKDQFNLGRRTLLDVLDSQNEEYVSRSNMINAEYVEIFAVYRLLALKGNLLQTMGIAVPREADPGVMLARHGY